MSPLQGTLRAMGVAALVVVLAVLVPGFLGQWAIGYVINLVSLVTIPLLWLVAMMMGARYRDPALFLIGFVLLPFAGLVALAASLAAPPEHIDIAELPLMLVYYLAAPLSVVIVGTLVLRSPSRHADSSTLSAPPPPVTPPAVTSPPPPPPPPPRSGRVGP